MTQERPPTDRPGYAAPVPDPSTALPTEAPLVASSAIDRRRLLKGAAVGAAAAWTAPAILSVDAAAAATVQCIPEVVSWTPFAVDIDDLENDPAQVPYGASGTLTLTFDGTTAPAPASSLAGYADVDPLGNESDNITLGMTATTAGDQVTLILDFDVPVLYLDLTLLDVDLGSGNWQDSIEVAAFDGVTPVAITAGMYTFNPTFVSATPSAPTVTFTGISDPSGTGSGVPNTSTNANVALSLVGPITQVVLTYIAGTLTPATPQPQQIGIGPLTVCL